MLNNRATHRYMQFEAFKLKVLHENSIHCKADDSRYVAHHLASLSLKQHSMIRIVRIPHIGTKRKPLTKAGSPNVIVHVVATYDNFQAVHGFLCRHVLGCLLDVHTHSDVFATYMYNKMVRGYTENLVIRRTIFIKSIIFCPNNLEAYALNKRVLQYLCMGSMCVMMEKPTDNVRCKIEGKPFFSVCTTYRCTICTYSTCILVSSVFVLCTIF